MPEYLLWSNQKGLWWRADERGYTSHSDEAGRYSELDAERIVRHATLDGQLYQDRIDPITGREYREYDEAMIPAPEPG